MNATHTQTPSRIHSARLAPIAFAVLFALVGCQRSDNQPAATVPAAATASAPTPTVEQLEAAVTENPLKDAYFGETHVHTSYSLDAYIGGARITPDEAYKFAQGADVVVNGQKHNIGRPLDWVAVSDHAEFIGEMYSTQVPGAKGSDNPMLEELRNLEERGRAAGLVPEVCCRTTTAARHPDVTRRSMPVPRQHAAPGRTSRSRLRSTTTGPANSRRWPATSGRPRRRPGTCIAMSSSVT